MIAIRPHFVLLTSSEVDVYGTACWKFTLQSVDGRAELIASDREPDIPASDLGAERLELLAVVRGLEALDQPSDVTLVTASRYVSRGIQYGLDEWRDNQWKWERFGRLAPVKDGDLWQRLDRALIIHRVVCCATRPNTVRAAFREAAPQAADSAPAARPRRQRTPNPWIQQPDHRVRRPAAREGVFSGRRGLAAALASWREHWSRTAVGMTAASLG